MGRRISAARTVRSILANDYPNFRVLLVDQCDEPLAPGAFPSDPRFEYVSSNTVGISAARNVGVEMAEDGVIVHTDDDCEAPPGWLSAIAETFRSRPDVDIAFGEVLAGKTAPGGFIPVYRVQNEVVVSRLRSKHRIEGIGACLAYRREVWELLGGFDEALGAGGEMRSAEEVDFTVRALARGRVVMETPRFHVVHHGYRAWENQDELLGGHLFGIGVTAAKQLRRGSPAYLYVMARLGWRWAFGAPVVDFGRPPARLPRLRAFLQGIRTGLRRPLDELDRLEAKAKTNGAAGKPRSGPPRFATKHEPFPNFFLIGAPKSGTSCVHEHLRAHPEIFMCAQKEPNFMAVGDSALSGAPVNETPDEQMRAATVWTLAEYVDLFRGKTTEKAIGEGSSWYLHSPAAAESIRLYAPGSKLIAVLRDPAERAYSAYRMHRRLGQEPLETFESALDARANLSRCSDWGLDYLGPGFYRRHLEAYREEWEDGRLQIHLTEDLERDPESAFKKMYEYLRVDARFKVVDAGNRLNAAPDRAPLTPETRERLIETYREDILGLQEMLGRDLSAWLRVEASKGDA
jgi:GT2 family glycosyltransferase